MSFGPNTSINPFFYGTYLAPTNSREPIARSKEESYQCDALSSMTTLNASYWSRMHTFRLEWEPGRNGSLRWYIDGVRRFEVLGKTLEEQGTMIPTEPSYVIFNTAISTSWGFPNPPPGCDYDHGYDCKSPTTQCGFNPGFCRTLPAKFKIDYVRIYQNKADPKHSIGCNPKAFPTKRFIMAHEYRYKSTHDVHALKPTVNGGARCLSDQTGKSTSSSRCGEGECVNSRCRCKKGWTGPTCLVPAYENDEPDWDAEEWIPYNRPYIPFPLLYACIAFFVAIVVTAYFALRSRKRHEKDSRGGYLPVPTNEDRGKEAYGATETQA